MSRKSLESASLRADRKLRNAIASRESARKGKRRRKPASDEQVARAAAESQHHALAWLADLTGEALR